MFENAVFMLSCIPLNFTYIEISEECQKYKILLVFTSYCYQASKVDGRKLRLSDLILWNSLTVVPV